MGWLFQAAMHNWFGKIHYTRFAHFGDVTQAQGTQKPPSSVKTCAFPNKLQHTWNPASMRVADRSWCLLTASIEKVSKWFRKKWGS